MALYEFSKESQVNIPFIGSRQNIMDMENTRYIAIVRIGYKVCDPLSLYRMGRGIDCWLSPADLISTPDFSNFGMVLPGSLNIVDRKVHQNEV